VHATRRIDLIQEWNHETVSMSSSEDNDDSGAEEATLNGDEINGRAHTPAKSNSNDGEITPRAIAELLQEERDAAPTPQQLGNGVNHYKVVLQTDEASEDGSLQATPRRTGSPIDSLLSVPDDSPSVQVRKATKCPRFY
jgi:vacuolar protein sorting-associated protein 8